MDRPGAEPGEFITSHARQPLHTDTGSTKAGAEPHKDLSPAHIVIGIKETPLSEVLTDALPTPSGSVAPRTHLMFSHTHKGQHYNMELLSKFLGHGDLSPRLIDYELLTDEDGRRTVGFGWYAGGVYCQCMRRPVKLRCINSRRSTGIAVCFGPRSSRDWCRIAILGMSSRLSV